MKNFFTRHWKSYMLRPAIYKAFSRFLYSLVIALLWKRLVDVSGLFSLKTYVFPIVGVCWGLASWFSYLRLDDIHIPSLFSRSSRRKPSRFSHTDLIDFTNETVISFDDLEEDERTLCCLVSDLICCVIFLLLSLL